MLRLPVNARLPLLAGIILLQQSSTCSAASPLAYDTILVIVYIELILAFAIGLICILFSCNLLVALKNSTPADLSHLSNGDLPPSRRERLLSAASTNSAVVRGTTHPRDDPRGLVHSNNNSDYRSLDEVATSRNHRPSPIDYEAEDVEYDYEGLPTTAFPVPPLPPRPRETHRRKESRIVSVVKTFTSYLKLW